MDVKELIVSLVYNDKGKVIGEKYRGELIRCKDCKHWDCDDSESYCLELGIFNTDMNSYCSYAKRKEHETN